jgi:outer membrane protein
MHTQIHFKLMNVYTAAAIAVGAVTCLVMPSASSVTLDDDNNVNRRLANIELRVENSANSAIPDALKPTTLFTLKKAIDYAQLYYPTILKSQQQMVAARENIKVQKLNEYMPDSLFQYQEIMASHNQTTSTVFSSPVFPGISGPGFNPISMTPYMNSAAGFSLDWAPVDFGLHKARIGLSKIQSLQAEKSYGASKIDVATAVANAFLDAAVAVEQMAAARENVKSFEQFHSIVQAQISGSLKPAADESLARAQLSNSRNDFIRAQLAYDVAMARIATSMGLGGIGVTIDTTGLATRDEPANIQQAKPEFADVPIVQVAKASVLQAVAQKKILDKEYFPVFHLLGGVSGRGAGLNTQSGKASSNDASGTVPGRPNYDVALIVNWNFLDIFRLNAEKKVQRAKISATEQDYELVLQNLKGQDVESRARVKAALALAQNMPEQVEAADIAVRQAEARYGTGLGSVAQVAEANQVLASSRVKQAAARVGVWRALLDVAYVHGDLTPFIKEADLIQRGQ